MNMSNLKDLILQNYNILKTYMQPHNYTQEKLCNHNAFFIQKFFKTHLQPPQLFVFRYRS